MEECRPSREWRCEFRKQGENNGTEQGPKDRSASTDQNRNKEKDREIEREGIRCNVGLQSREQPASDCRRGARKDEYRHQKAGLADTGRLRRDISVSDGNQPAAETAVSDIRCHPCDESGNGKTEKIETTMGVEWRGHLRSGQANAATGHTLPCQRDLRDNRRKTQRTDCEVKRAQPKRRQSDDHAEDRAGDARDR